MELTMNQANMNLGNANAEWTPVRDNRVFYTILMQREYASSPYH